MRAPEQSTKSHLEEIRAYAQSDRDIYDKGRLAFVTHVRSYKSHKVGILFPPALMVLFDWSIRHAV